MLPQVEIVTMQDNECNIRELYDSTMHDTMQVAKYANCNPETPTTRWRN